MDHPDHVDSSGSSSGTTTAQLLAAALQHKLERHRASEQAAVDALLASQRHLTSNVRTLINGLDAVLALGTPKCSAAQGDLVSRLLSTSRGLARKLEGVGDRLARIEAHLTARDAAAAAAAAAQQDAEQQEQQQHAKEPDAG